MKLFEDGNFKGEDREEYVMGLVMILARVSEYVFIGKKTKLIFLKKIKIGEMVYRTCMKYYYI